MSVRSYSYTLFKCLLFIILQFLGRSQPSWFVNSISFLLEKCPRSIKLQECILVTDFFKKIFHSLKKKIKKSKPLNLWSHSLVQLDLGFGLLSCLQVKYFFISWCLAWPAGFLLQILQKIGIWSYLGFLLSWLEPHSQLKNIHSIE